MDRMGKNKEPVSVILGIYVLLIGVGVPLVFRKQYSDILLIKYYYYCCCTFVMIALLLVYFVVKGRKNIYFKKKNIKNLLVNITLTDYAVLFYLIVAVISTITSDYVYESFWGNEGRLTGLFLTSLYILSFFCVSRFWKFDKIYIDMILIAGLLVSLFGITDYFKLDILGFNATLQPNQKAVFTSTIGNINTYTAYVGIIVAIATVLYTTCKGTKRLIFYYLCMIISFFAIIMGVSDNAYLSLAALFVFLPLYLFNKKKGIRRYLIVLATFFSVVQCIDWINSFLVDYVLGIDSAFNIVIEFKYLHFIVILLWAIIALWYFIDYKTRTGVEVYGNVLRYAWLGMIGFILFGILYVIYDCNVAGNIERYRNVSNYLMFNDEWGTHRGYIWRNAVEGYLNFPVWKKIFGFGPETFGILLLQKTTNNSYHQIYDNAHNEYLQTLITVGIAGLTTYLIFIISYIKRCFCYKKKSPYVIAVSFGVICYSVQAVVNLNVPIVFPVFWLLLGMGAAKSIEK